MRLTKVTELEEIEQSPREKVKTAYMFILADYQEGLNYPVSKELYNEHIELLGGSEVVDTSVKTEKYLNDIYALF